MCPDSKHTLLSDVDFAIVQLLKRDGRMSNRDLANNLGVSEVTVRKRLKKLRENSVLSIVAIVEPQQLGYNLDVIISLRVDVRHLEEVAEKLTQFPEVRYVAITSGAHDILCAVLFKDTEDLLNFLVKKLSTFRGVVATDTTFSLKVLKRTHDWFSVTDEGIK